MMDWCSHDCTRALEKPLAAMLTISQLHSLLKGLEPLHKCMRIREAEKDKTHPLNCSLSKYDVTTSHILLEKSEDKCLLQTGEGSQKENKSFYSGCKL